MDVTTTIQTYDALIVGGGPAGLAAAVYLARACRTVAVFDCKRPGRSDWAQTNHNYLGFPEGITAVELTQRGRQQAERFGATFFDAEVTRVWRQDTVFSARTADLTLHGRALLLAPGVRDRWVTFPGYEEYIGRSMHWCIVCDGFEMQGKRVLVVGNDEQTAEEAIQMRGFTRDVAVLTNSGSLGLRPETVDQLDERGIRLIVGRISGARSRKKGYFEAILLEGGMEVELDHLFSVQGADPVNDLPRSLGVTTTPEGYVIADREGRTDVPGVYVAGDVTPRHSHQIGTAVFEGATAASALNHELFQRDLEAFAAGRGKTSD